MLGTIRNYKILFRPIYRSLTSFKHSDLQIELTTKPLIKPDFDNLAFGHEFSDHMFSVDWVQDKGWQKPRIHPLSDFSIHPGAKVFHYATELFEGMKAYYCADGKIRLFRPIENMKRMNQSCEQAMLPEFDNKELLKCIKTLVYTDRDWIPKERGKSLYIRPTAIATEATLGVSQSNTSRIFVLLCPVGAYFPTGLKPVTLLADPKFVRAWPGGCGASKLGANYAPTIKIQSEAIHRGCQQILWLFGDNHLITEVGTMNIFVLWKNSKGEKELVTPPLNGLILPGVTRMSVLELTKKWGDLKVREGEISMSELVSAVDEDRVLEMFGSGTACVVCPVERIFYQNRDLAIPTMSKGAPVTMRVLQELNDIQYGVTKHPWSDIVEG